MEEAKLDMKLKNSAQPLPVPWGDSLSPSEKAEIAHLQLASPIICKFILSNILFRDFIGCVNKFACGTFKKAARVPQIILVWSFYSPLTGRSLMLLSYKQEQKYKRFASAKVQFLLLVGWWVSKNSLLSPHSGICSSQCICSLNSAKMTHVTIYDILGESTVVKINYIFPYFSEESLHFQLVPLAANKELNCCTGYEELYFSWEWVFIL